MTYRVVRFRREDGCVTGIAGEPRDKYTHVVIFETPIRLLRVPNDEARAYMTDLPEKVKPAAKQMLAAGRRLGITDGAKDALKEVLQ